MVDVLVLGATGFTGELIVRYLIQHPERSKFTLGIAARSKSKLDALKRNLNVPDSVQVFYVDVTNQNDLEEVVQISKVVINAVGPFWRWGTPVVSTCVRHGKHYVDLTGESHWIRELVLHHDYPATKTRSIIIPSSGFDSVPSDLIVYLANKTLKTLAGPETDIDNSITAFKVKGGISGGTWSSIFSIIEEVPAEKIALARKDWALSTSFKGVPQPAKRLTYTLPFSTPPVVGGLWLMASANRAIVQRTCGMLQREALISQSPEARSRTYGPNFKYDEFLALRSTFSAVVVSLGMVFGFACMLLAPLRWLVKKLVPPAGEGLSEQEMKEGFLKMTNITSSAAAPTKPATHVRTTIKGQGDPGYSLTAVIIAESGLSLALSHSELPEIAQKGGVLTPATALGDVLIKRLEASGRMTFESEVVVGSEVESRKTR